MPYIRMCIDSAVLACKITPGQFVKSMAVLFLAGHLDHCHDPQAPQSLTIPLQTLGSAHGGQLNMGNTDPTGMSARIRVCLLPLLYRLPSDGNKQVLAPHSSILQYILTL